MIKRSEKEIEEQMSEAGAIVAGVDAALRWVLGDEDPPIEKE